MAKLTWGSGVKHNADGTYSTDISLSGDTFYDGVKGKTASGLGYTVSINPAYPNKASVVFDSDPSKDIKNGSLSVNLDNPNLYDSGNLPSGVTQKLSAEGTAPTSAPQGTPTQARIDDKIRQLREANVTTTPTTHLQAIDLAAKELGFTHDDINQKIKDLQRSGLTADVAASKAYEYFGTTPEKIQSIEQKFLDSNKMSLEDATAAAYTFFGITPEAVAAKTSEGAAEAKAIEDKAAADKQKAADDKLPAFREDRLAKSLAFDPNAGRKSRLAASGLANPASAENLAKIRQESLYSDAEYGKAAIDTYKQSLHNPFSGGRYDTTNSSGNVAADAMEQADAAAKKTPVTGIAALAKTINDEVETPRASSLTKPEDIKTEPTVPYRLTGPSGLPISSNPVQVPTGAAVGQPTLTNTTPVKPSTGPSTGPSAEQMGKISALMGGRYIDPDTRQNLYISGKANDPSIAQDYIDSVNAENAYMANPPAQQPAQQPAPTGVASLPTPTQTKDFTASFSGYITPETRMAMEKGGQAKDPKIAQAMADSIAEERTFAAQQPGYQAGYSNKQGDIQVFNPSGGSRYTTAAELPSYLMKGWTSQYVDPATQAIDPGKVVDEQFADWYKNNGWTTKDSQAYNPVRVAPDNTTAALTLNAQGSSPLAVSGIGSLPTPQAVAKPQQAVPTASNLQTSGIAVLPNQQLMFKP